MGEDKSEHIRTNLKKAVWIVAGFSAIINLLMLALPLYSLQVLDRVLSSGSHETLLMITIVVGLLLIFFGIFSILRDFVMNGTAKWLDKEISPHLVRQTYDEITITTGRLPSQNLRDFDAIKTFISGPALKALFDAPWSLIFLVVLFMIHSWLAYITLLAGVIILGIASLSEKYVKKPQEKASEFSGQEMAQIDSFHRNSATIKAMRMEDAIKSRWSDIHDKLSLYKEISQSKTSIISNSAKSFRMIVQMFVTCVGGYLVLDNQMTVGGMIAASILASRVLAPFEVAISAWTQFVNVRKSYKNIKDITWKSFADKGAEIKLPTPKGDVSFENVSFKFDPKSTSHILHCINLKVNAGESLAIVGPSASGKSTLAALMVGVWKPVIGNVRLDGANIYDMTSAESGSHIGYLGQNIEFFDGTVKENIARMSNEIDDEKIIQAAQITGNHDMILRFPDGYETVLGRGKYNLSSGQKQRLALTRAFYGDPKLLVLDEPNSNLDERGDIVLQQALQYAKSKNITTIIITHRPAILGTCDKTLVLNDGRIIDHGNVESIKKKFQQTRQIR